MQAYTAGVAALRISLKGVSVERAENLVDQIQEVMMTNLHGLCYSSLNIVIHLLNEGLYFAFMLFAQLCDTQDEVNQTLAGGVLDSGIQVSLYVFHCANAYI